ncbi:MAG: hypothetical protein HBSAPP03_06880 [Phycisphaerae bacterium]|nr:MAG: hypothetical protein HBSAPP03_06880 [Phycisphaerae bacterium]
MARRKVNTSPIVGESLTIRQAAVLVVASRRASREGLVARLAGTSARVEGTDTEHAPKAARGFDLVVIDCPHPLEVWGRVQSCGVGAACVVIRAGAEALFLAEAMRAGVADVVEPDAAPEALQAALAGAFDRVQRSRDSLVRERRRTRRLRALCGTLFKSRHELMRQMGELCADMAASYRDLSDRLTGVSMASEFNAILRQELDLEGLLRTTLEYTLRKVGSTNAAIFLPNSLGDFALGAYVNYDCPKDTCESLLDHLADVAPPAFEHRDEAAVLRDGSEIAAALGRGDAWLAEAAMVGVPAKQDGEAVAVCVFFRDHRTPFTPTHVRMLTLVCDLFGGQLSRVIRTHNRHLPKDAWDKPGDGEAGSDDIDLAG